MLLDEEELRNRVESPLNLLNRLRNVTNPHRRLEADIPLLPPKASDIIPNLDDKINNGAIKSKAMGLITQAMDELKNRMPEVVKPRELASIAAEMSKIVSAVEPRQEVGANAPQIIIYAPQVMSEDTYNVIQLNEV